MVISDKYKYLFIEMYNTGSTSISNELCELYDGKRILRKHSRYHEFLEIATEEQKKYFVFSGIRNPMDSIVTVYSKLAGDHKGKFSSAKDGVKDAPFVKEGRLNLYKDVVDNNLSFKDFFKKYYKLPYDKWSRLDHSKFDYLIHYENIQEDFQTVLKKLKIQPKRELPRLNRTEGKKHFEEYYTPDIRKRAIFVFAPFMARWGYSFPPAWNITKPPLISKILFDLLGIKRGRQWRKKKLAIIKKTT